MSLKLYLITCDLVEDGDHGSLRERLRTLEARQVLDRQWAVRSTHTAAQLRDLLRQFLGDRDRIVVAEIGEERASRRAMADLGEMQNTGRDLMRHRSPQHFVAVDLLWLEGQDLRHLPLRQRKQRLRDLVPDGRPVLYAGHVPESGVDLFRVVCEQDRERSALCAAAVITF